MDPSDKPDAEIAPQPIPLKDRIALRVKALQHAAPGAAADLKARVVAGASAAGLDKINRETLKAGRDGLAAKVEAMLKPRPADVGPHGTHADKPAATGPAPEPRSDEQSAKPADPERADISALKAKLDAALRPKDEAGVTVRPDKVSAGIAARIAAALPKGEWKKPDWTGPFTRSRRQPVEGAATALPTRAAMDEAGSVDVAPQVSSTRTTRTDRLKTERIVARTRPKRSLLTVGMLATALVTGAVLHIVTTFAIPALSSSWFRWSAYDRIKGQLDINTMKIWPVDPTGEMPLPFLSPDMRYAFCRFDITSGPVNVSMVLPEAGWSLALYTPSGDNFYAVPGQDGRIVEAVFNIVPASDRLLIPVPGQRRADVDAAQVTSPAREGLVVVRGPNKGAASLPAVETALRRARCTAVERR
jgi:uncharacterized membrane protein